MATPIDHAQLPPAELRPEDDNSGGSGSTSGNSGSVGGGTSAYTATYTKTFAEMSASHEAPDRTDRATTHQCIHANSVARGNAAQAEAAASNRNMQESLLQYHGFTFGHNGNEPASCTSALMRLAGGDAGRDSLVGDARGSIIGSDVDSPPSILDTPPNIPPHTDRTSFVASVRDHFRRDGRSFQIVPNSSNARGASYKCVDCDFRFSIALCTAKAKPEFGTWDFTKKTKKQPWRVRGPVHAPINDVCATANQ